MNPAWAVDGLGDLTGVEGDTLDYARVYSINAGNVPWGGGGLHYDIDGLNA